MNAFFKITVVQNIIRTALWKDHYMNIYEPSDFEYHWGAYGMRHVMHCVDALRQAIECASDISVVVWQWSDISQKALGHGDIVHTCRNFDSIRNWSAKRKFIGEFRPEVFIADDL
jgi:mycotoxin biosynthesis protein UstYa